MNNNNGFVDNNNVWNDQLQRLNFVNLLNLQ